MVLTVIQLVLVFLLVILILLQPPESDNLSGFGGTQGNLDSMFSTGSSSNFITKLTVAIATAFIINTVLLVGVNAKSVHKESIVKKIAEMSKAHNLPPMEHDTEDSVPFNQ
ncbi:preprotein translocase subunit SecG [Ehrlichia canis]|uniref:Protein translocase subunit secG n=1 Tax=Ehrlichia canis (strain Jake) TaxID=269484 RepID=A0ACA6AV66_EHRCJ|nr:preprotein translocase subunit SecG [Ehrlichia canis]AAZ68166.1 protein translocase subunit secG [Ehrlichia canis str. Jake]AUO54421.1 preprotein translocase subunit SecG [Ehrlichia canis]UKC53788.1 secG [Ehrlichia canis]UKC54725.1 secG [Ehrlichia canis]UKC55661.1 secG [Ehrlichia canis]